MTSAFYYPIASPFYRNFNYQQYSSYSPFIYDNYMNAGWYNNNMTWSPYNPYVIPYYYLDKNPYFNGAYTPYVDHASYLYNYYMSGAPYNYYWPVQPYFYPYYYSTYQRPAIEYPMQSANYQNEWYEYEPNTTFEETADYVVNHESQQLNTSTRPANPKLALPEALGPDKGLSMLDSVDDGTTGLGDETEYVIRVENYESLNASSKQSQPNPWAPKITATRSADDRTLVSVNSQGDYIKPSPMTESAGVHCCKDLDSNIFHAQHYQETSAFMIE